MKTLRNLLSDIGQHSLEGPADITITSVEADSRRVAPGSLFVALRIPGTNSKCSLPGNTVTPL